MKFTLVKRNLNNKNQIETVIKTDIPLDVGTSISEVRSYAKEVLEEHYFYRMTHRKSDGTFLGISRPMERQDYRIEILADVAEGTFTIIVIEVEGRNAFEYLPTSIEFDVEQ